MELLIKKIEENLKEAFEKAGYDKKYARVVLSNRPDLCEYQCNGAMAAAKEYKKRPLDIAEDVLSKMNTDLFEKAEVCNPGFINLNISQNALDEYVNLIYQDEKLGIRKIGNKKTVVDYGGANVAKPLHVGHLRSAVIGEAIVRLRRFMGDQVIGDAHLGDWGLQIGLIITELKERQPDLPYFDPKFTGEYPSQAPFTIQELSEIYPTANVKSKNDEEYLERARQAILDLQGGNKGYHAIWQHIINLSIEDLKKNYSNLNVAFTVWGKESDAQPLIPEMVEYLKTNGYAHYSEGALVVDVAKESDTKEVPPCMILKSNGASLYDTTDLATIIDRRRKYDPDRIIYVVDKRQELYFERVFRCARKTKMVEEKTDLTFLGFGTVNGKDGKPFKTRDGGVMQLSDLIGMVNDAVLAKMMENKQVPEEEARETSKVIGLAALKYGDLSNQASKDYVFDLDRFTSFEGNSGPYILYTIVRIKSILEKYKETTGKGITAKITSTQASGEKELKLILSRFNDMMEQAYLDLAPHKICAYIYELSNAFNKFYHDTKILGCQDEQAKESYITLLDLTKKVLEQSIDVLGFEAPDRM